MDYIIKTYLIEEKFDGERFVSQEAAAHFGPASRIAYREVLDAVSFDIDTLFLSVDNLLVALKIDADNFISQNDFAKAEHCLTAILSTNAHFKVMFYEVFLLIGTIHLKRSEVRAALKKKAGAVSDAVVAHCNSQDAESYFLLSKRLAEFDKRVHSVQVLIFALASETIVDHHSYFDGFVVEIAKGIAKLRDDEIDLRQLPSQKLFWLRHVSVWNRIVEELAKNDEYNALGVITIGTCENMRAVQTPNIFIFKSANIPGLNCKSIDIGKMLKSLSDQGLRQWHLRMAEFLIKQKADVKTIATAFDQPLLVIMATLSMNAGENEVFLILDPTYMPISDIYYLIFQAEAVTQNFTSNLKHSLENDCFISVGISVPNLDVPSFLDLGFPSIPVTELDAQDNDGNTAFHMLLKGTHKERNSAVDILCRSLLAQGCLPSLRNHEGKMAHEYIPSSTKLYQKLSHSVANSWQGLSQRLEKIRSLAKKEMDAAQYDNANEIYKKGLLICQNFPDVVDEILKYLTNLSIVNDKMKNYDQSLFYAEESLRICDGYYKGHHWAGNAYSKLGDYLKATKHFMVCFDKQESEGYKISLLLKALKLLPDIYGTPDFDTWFFIARDPKIWPEILEKMTSHKLWSCLKLFILGPPLSAEGHGHCWNYPASTANLRHIFEVVDDPNIHADRLVLALLQNGANIKTIAPTSKDIMHEVVRFCALTNDTAVLKYVLSQMKEIGLDFCPNADGKTPLHKLCHLTGKRVKMETKVKLAQMLYASGLDPKTKDVDGKTAADYAPEKSAFMDYLKKIMNPDKEGTFEDKNIGKGTGLSKEEVTWQALKEQGSHMYKTGKYQSAFNLYKEALKKCERGTGSSKGTKHDTAVLYSNLSECALKMNALDEALEMAQKCVEWDAQWFKGHLKVGYAFSRMGYCDKAMEAFANSYRRIQETGYSQKIFVLSEFVASITAFDRKEGLTLGLIALTDNSDVLLELTMHFLKEKKFDLAHASCVALVSVPRSSFRRHRMDLKHICTATMFLKPSEDWIRLFLHIALDSNEEVASLKFHEGDTYFHAVVNIYCSMNFPLDNMFDGFLKDNLKDKNMCDSKGNTVLHFLAESNKGKPKSRLELANKLIQFGVDFKAFNNAGKQAIDLCGKMDEMRMLLKHYMKTEESIETLKNSGIERSSSKGPVRSARERRSSVPKQPRTDSRSHTFKDAQESRRAHTSMQRSKPSMLSQPRSKSQDQVSSQPRTSQKFEHHSKPQLACEDCIRLMKEAEQCKKEQKDSKVFSNLAMVVNKKHNLDPRHKNLRDTCLERLAANLAIRSDDDIPESLLQINSEGCRELINHLVKRNKWKQIHHLVLAFKTKKGWESLKTFARHVPLSEFLSSESLAGQEEERLKIFNFFLDNGGVIEDATSAKLVQCAMASAEFRVVLMLLEKGANPAGVTFSVGDTPLHSALLIALERDIGNFAVFDELTSSDSSGHKKYKNLDMKCQDVNRDNLLHLAAKTKSTDHSAKAVERLMNNHVPKNQKNKANQLPFDCLPNAQDPRAAILGTSPHTSLGQPTSIKPSPGARPKTSSVMIGGNSFQILREEMEKTLSKVQDSNYVLLAEEEDGETDENSSDEEEDSEDNDDGDNSSGGSNNLSDDGIDDNVDEQDKDEISVDASAFDNLPWEVECTEEVWNILKARKERLVLDNKVTSKKTMRKERITDDLKRIIVRKIQDLASGEWRSSLTKRIKRNVPSSLLLHYIKLPHGGYVLWELAVTYSARCSKHLDEIEAVQNARQMAGSGRGRIYSEIIRVWSISSNHSGLKGTIEKIVKSHQNGKKCIVKKNLKCISSQQFTPSSTASRIPMRYEETDVTFHSDDDDSVDNTTSLCPPASTGKTEYHILKFYSFSSALVSTILKNILTKVEFPFKVTDKEHELINLETKTPLLLIGRSGTGKTTVCLYRLWAKFLGYWERVGKTGDPILPRVLPALMDQDGGEDNNENSTEEEKTKKSKQSIEPDSDTDGDQLNDESLGFKLGDDDRDDESGQEDEDDEQEEEESHGKAPEFHHLHQLFVTKNPKLCSEVKKSFHRLCQATNCTIFQLRETEALPNTLEDITENAFPLFLTSRQLLIMLDASTDVFEGSQTFFERDENLAIKAAIPGWGTQRDIFHDIPLEVDSSDDEDGGAAAAQGRASYNRSMSGHGGSKGGARRKHKPNRRECTYDVFAREVWPSIKKKEIHCHPSLVWTEIMSFIKGSYEALHTEKGCLDEKQYLEIGRKRAPNFSGDRSEVYKIFKGYASYRAKNYLFDEADFIFDIYNRLKMMTYRPWVFHEIYVDEIQDFTQGELYLLINLCNDPNKMFLTGDTAQTIMRGISFRFEDLKSLFYYAQKKSQEGLKNQSPIKLPKGYEQLKYNYRSHTGILSLASAVLNLLAEFFKDSFDILEPDQGMFPGPLPVVIETCNPGDLAFLLSGNRRKTSHIEFGAHQAILVVNEEAKENLPQELRSGIVLTIYESKGLEFDDILIYNFFKDSKATEEWRVVTSYLNRLKMMSEDEKVPNYGTVNLDSDVLERTGRPHPLSFDPNKHKVLNAEFKHLYTAVTRARVNVWLFDEDLNKRAPMFEYFKALKLVRCTNSGEKDDAIDADTFFAEESTPREWKKKGDIFMAQKLYGPAVQCYSKAQATGKQRLAQAHLSAQKAHEMKEKENVSSKEVKRAYFKTGAEFVYCGVLRLAAICFLNAKEVGLAALAFEKNGEFEEAGRRYREINENVKASKCFKKCALYQRAINVLCEGKEFEKAIDCLQEYESMVQNLQDQNKAIHPVLRDNKPKETEDSLLQELIKEYNKMKDKDRLKATIKRLSKAMDQVKSLREHKFFTEAADILKNQGKYKEAVEMLIKEDMPEEALNYAELSLMKPLQASAHLTIACKMYTQEEHSPQTQKGDALSHCKEAKAIYQETDDKQGIVQSTLLMGMIKKDPELLKTAAKGFHNNSPANPIGTIEAFKEYLKIKKTKQLEENEMKLAFQVIETGILVIETLRKPPSKDADSDMAYLISYELQPAGPDRKITWARQQVPLSILTRARIDHQRCKKREKSWVVSELCASLEKDIHSWTKLTEISLNARLQKNLPCKNFQIGITCSESDKCPHSHSIGRTKEEIMSVLDTLCHKVMFEWLLEDFLQTVEGENRENWQSTEALLEFLPPGSQRLSLVPYDVMAQVVQKIRNNSIVKKQLCRYFKFQWGNSGRVGRGKSSDIVKERAKESRWFIHTCFFAQLLNLRLDVEREAIIMENDLHQKGKSWLSKVNKYAIFAVWDNKRDEVIAVESLGRRFIKSFNCLTGSATSGERGTVDLFEALFPFTKLIGAFGKRGNLSLMPDLDHLLFWMEFYSMMSFFFLAEIYQRDTKKPRHFFMPASYKSVVDLVNICKGKSTVEKDIVSHRFKQQYPKKMLFERQDFIINLLTGCKRFSKISLIQLVGELCQGRNHLVAERILVLSLTLLLNMKLQYLDQRLLWKIRESLQNLPCPDGISERLSNLIQSVKKIGNALEVMEILSDFLKTCQRDSLCVASWNNQKASILELTILNVNVPDHVKKILKAPFPGISTQDNSNELYQESTDMEDDGEVERPDADELERESQSRNQMRCLEERRKQAVQIIIRSLRLWLMKISLKKRSFKEYERQVRFKDFVLKDSFCGICNQPLDQNFEGPSMSSELKDDLECDEILTPSKIHEKSPSHKDQLSKFLTFKNFFISQIHDNFRTIENFMLSRQVLRDPDNPKDNPPMYAPNDTGYLVKEYFNFQRVTDTTLAQRWWTYEVVSTAFNQLQTTFFASYSAINAVFQIHQSRAGQSNTETKFGANQDIQRYDFQDEFFDPLNYNPSTQPKMQRRNWRQKRFNKPKKREYPRSK